MKTAPPHVGGVGFSQEKQSERILLTSTSLHIHGALGIGH